MWNGSILKKVFLGLFSANLGTMLIVVAGGATAGWLFVTGTALALCGRLLIDAPVRAVAGDGTEAVPDWLFAAA